MKLFSLFIFLIIATGIKAQELNSYYFGIGVNASYAPLNGLNNVLRHYQNMRFEEADISPEGEKWINNLSDINLLVGPSISFGYMFKPEYNIEFRYLDRRNSRVSQVQNINGSIIKRELFAKSRSFGFGLSKLFAAGKNDYIVGGTVNVTHFVIDATNLIDPQPINQSNFGSTIFIKYIFNFSETSPFAIVINPFYQYHFTPIDFFELNRVMNPETYQSLNSKEIKGARSYFGLEIQLNYFVFTGFKKEPIEN